MASLVIKYILKNTVKNQIDLMEFKEIEKKFEKEEAEILKQIGSKLLARLQARACGDKSEEAFAAECAQWADHLCQAPGGLDLVKMTRCVTE